MSYGICLPFYGVVLVFAHLCQHRNGLQRMSLAAVLGVKMGAPSLFSGGVLSNHLAAQVLYPVGVNRSRPQLVSAESLGAVCVLGHASL